MRREVVLMTMGIMMCVGANGDLGFSSFLEAMITFWRLI
jgi:hypothetical protein